MKKMKGDKEEQVREKEGKGGGRWMESTKGKK